jgi:hypothetical protein
VRPTFQDLYADGAFPNPSQESVLVLECGAGSSDLVKDIQVDTGQVITVLPIRADFAFQMEERNFVSRDRGNTGNLGAKELR